VVRKIRLFNKRACHASCQCEVYLFYKNLPMYVYKRLFTNRPPPRATKARA
jgi:hypothetical protein